MPKTPDAGGWVLLKTPRLRELRERVALSQEGLAKKSGVSRATIADLEAGKRPARPSTRRKLAEALGVEPAELMDSEPWG
jgi:transcriptional regulator with XRE-family HTH domain